MSADNFLVIRERTDNKWEVFIARLSGWDNFLGQKPDEQIDAYLDKYADKTDEVFDSEDAAHDFVHEFENENYVEYSGEVHRRKVK